MDNKAKIFTIFFALESFVTSIASIDKSDSDELLKRLLLGGKEDYEHQERIDDLDGIKLRIESFLGELSQDNIDLIIPLWLAYEQSIDDFYFLLNSRGVRMFFGNAAREKLERLQDGYRKYQSDSNSLPQWWEKIKASTERSLSPLIKINL